MVPIWWHVVRGLLCQWFCDWTWYEVCCVTDSVTGCGTRFDVSMVLWLDVVRSLMCQRLWLDVIHGLMCQRLSDWMWYEICCVNDSVTGRGTRFDDMVMCAYIGEGCLYTLYIRRIVTVCFIAPYKYSYLLTYWHTLPYRDIGTIMVCEPTSPPMMHG